MSLGPIPPASRKARSCCSSVGPGTACCRELLFPTMAPLKTAPCSAPTLGSQTPRVSPATRRLVVNADDFGRSSAINAAVFQAHREGILTTASLMVNEPGTEEAVDMARREPRLGVGLHLTL